MLSDPRSYPEFAGDYPIHCPRCNARCLDGGIAGGYACGGHAGLAQRRFNGIYVVFMDAGTCKTRILTPQPRRRLETI